jgi:hypothetical protein
MPLILGNGIWEEDLYRYTMYGEAVCNASGVAFATLSQDLWLAVAAAAADSYVGTVTPGKPLWATNASYVGATSPAQAATVATAGLIGSSLASDGTYGGANPVPNTRLLQTASAIRARPISKADDFAGQIMVAYTKDTVNYPLTGVSFDTVRAYPDDVVIKRIDMCANWPNDAWLEMPSLPVERQAFQAHLPYSGGAGAGNVTVDHPTVAIFAEGLTTGQSFEVEAVAIYQFEITGSDRVEDVMSPIGAPPVTYQSESSGNGVVYTNRPPQQMRGMMTDIRGMSLANRAARRVTGRRVPAKHMGNVHIKNPRSMATATAVLEEHPSLISRIRGIPRKAWNYIKSNWFDLLKSAVPLVLGAL